MDHSIIKNYYKSVSQFTGKLLSDYKWNAASSENYGIMIIVFHFFSSPIHKKTQILASFLVCADNNQKIWTSEHEPQVHWFSLCKVHAKRSLSILWHRIIVGSTFF